MTPLRLCFFLILLASCTGSPNKTNPETIRMGVLRGPSAVAFARLMSDTAQLNGRTLILRIIDSPQLMQAQWIKGETDIAVLPMTSAANLYNKRINLRLSACPVWGTLYLVSRTPLAETKTVYLFGRGTTPDILTRYYMDKNHFPVTETTFNYSFSTPREIMQALLARKVHTAVLSEPFLSMALKKDTSLHIAANLNSPDGKGNGFPQTAIVIQPELLPLQLPLDSILQASCRFATENPQEAIRIAEEHEIFPAGFLTEEGIKRCMIAYQPAGPVRDEVNRFLQLIYQYEPRAIGNRIPDSLFIAGQP